MCNATMDTGIGRFNIYLLAALAALLFCGCQTHSKKNIRTALRVHTEAKENTTFSKKITVIENPRIEMRVDDSPIVTEAMVTEAKVVEAMGGFALMIKFDSGGKWLLDQHSSLNLGRHFAIYVDFGGKEGKARWIAAPIISNRISDGMLLFTPDVTREEADQIAAGLNPPPDKKAKPGTETK